MTIMSGVVEVGSLQQAQSQDKKHRKLEEEVRGHEVVVERVLQAGAELQTSTAYTELVAENSAKLSAAWAELLAAVQSRAAALKQSLTAQQFFFEVAEVETWLRDRVQSIQVRNLSVCTTVAQTTACNIY